MDDPFRALRLDPASELTIQGQIRAQLKLLIVDGRVRPGSRLPSVRVLAHRLGVNVNTVRSAYAMLEEERVAVTRHGVGTTVLEPDARRLTPAGPGALSNTVGVIIAGLDPLYLDLVRGIEVRANEHGTLLFIVDAAESHDRARVAIQQLRVRGALGVIAVHLGDTDAGDSNGAALPMVYVDQPGREGHVLMFNAEKAGFDATQHLVRHGHDRIGYVTAPLYWPNQTELRSGHERALREHGLAVDGRTLVGVDRSTVDEGRRGLRALLASGEPPSAVVASGGRLAVGILQEARHLGLKVPDDLAIVGYADTEIAQFTQPALTMVSLPTYEIGSAAMDLLRRIVADPATPPSRTVFDGVLEVRESCGSHPWR